MRKRRTAQAPSSGPSGLISAEEWADVRETLGLARQQGRVVRLIMAGRRDKQIAAEMGIGVTTVRTHLRHLYWRLGVADRVELVLLVCSTLRSRLWTSGDRDG